MNKHKSCLWKSFSSKSELNNLQSFYEPIEDINPDRWGVLTVKEHKNIAVSYRDMGVAPSCNILEETIFVGINSKVYGYEVSKKDYKFIYNMPTVFYNFVADYTQSTIVLDEIGLVEISTKGEELWRFIADDVITSFQVKKKLITLKTYEGEEINVNLPKQIIEQK